MHMRICRPRRNWVNWYSEKKPKIALSHILTLLVQLAALSACARWGWRRIHTIFASTTEELAYACCFMAFWVFLAR